MGDAVVMTNLRYSHRVKCDGVGRAALPDVQLGLFDEPLPVACVPSLRPANDDGAVAETGPVVRLQLGASSVRRATRSGGTPSPRSRLPRMIRAADMPPYPKEEVAAVEQAIAGIRTDRQLLGYKDLKAYFGVSKATANRRMKDGLVPGVRILEGRVLRDGGVRRLSREQVRWLLLAVRNHDGPMRDG